MGVDDIVRECNVLIRKGVKSDNLNSHTDFDKDVQGWVLQRNGPYAVVDVSDANVGYKYRIYNVDKLELVDQE